MKVNLLSRKESETELKNMISMVQKTFQDKRFEF